jgi:hypothetical protein
LDAPSTQTNTGKNVTNLKYEANLPAGLTINATTGKITGTPTIGETSGSFTINVSSIDYPGLVRTIAYNYVVETFSITSSPQNISWKINNTVSFAAPTTKTNTGNDVNNLTYSAANLPAGLTIDSATGIISGIPTVGNPIASFTITVKSTDYPDVIQTITHYYGVETFTITSTADTTLE